MKENSPTTTVKFPPISTGCYHSLSTILLRIPPISQDNSRFQRKPFTLSAQTTTSPHLTAIAVCHHYFLPPRRHLSTSAAIVAIATVGIAGVLSAPLQNRLPIQHFHRLPKNRSLPFAWTRRCCPWIVAVRNRCKELWLKFGIWRRNFRQKNGAEELLIAVALEPTTLPSILHCHQQIFTQEMR